MHSNDDLTSGTLDALQEEESPGATAQKAPLTSSEKFSSSKTFHDDMYDVSFSTDVGEGPRHGHSYRAIVFQLDDSNNWTQLGIGVCSYVEVFPITLSFRNLEKTSFL